MGGLIGGKPMKKFISSAPVVYLVKHGPCHIGFHCREGILFVEKGGVIFCVYRKDGGAIGPAGHQLIEDALVIGSYNAQIPQAVVDVNFIPCKYRFRRSLPVYHLPGTGNLIKSGEGKVPGVQVPQKNGKGADIRIFPEIQYDQVEKIRGMDICFVTTAKTDEEARELLRAMGMPFKK